MGGVGWGGLSKAPSLKFCANGQPPSCTAIIRGSLALAQGLNCGQVSAQDTPCPFKLFPVFGDMAYLDVASHITSSPESGTVPNSAILVLGLVESYEQDGGERLQVCAAKGVAHLGAGTPGHLGHCPGLGLVHTGP